MYVQQPSVSSILSSRLSLIVLVNVVLNGTVVVDSDWRFDNLCASHLQRQSELYHIIWWYYTLVIDLIGQLRRHVIGRLSVKLWCHWLWRLVKLLLKWLLGSNLSQLYLAACENSTTLLRLCKWASVYERCLSCRVRRCNRYVLAPTTPPPPIPSTPQAPEVRFVVDQRFQTKWMNEKNITTYFILNFTDCVVNYCSSILFNCHYYQTKIH